MKIKNLLLSGLLLTGLNTFSQAFSVMYPFSAVNSGSVNTGTVDPTPVPVAPGITCGSFVTVGTSTSAAANGAFCFSGWSTGATNNNDATFTGSLTTSEYYQVSITPNVSYSVTLTSITFHMLRSGTGPRNWAVRSNKDGYTANLPAAIMSNTNLATQPGNNFFWSVDSYTTNTQQRGSTVNLAGPNFNNQTTPYIFRFYAWNSESGAGTFRIDTARFNGMSTLILGVNEITQDLNSSIKIYPNPSNGDMMYVEPKNINYSKVEILNILGSVVATETKESQVSEKIKLNLNSLSAGTYFVRVTDGSKVYTERFFIAK